MGADVEASTAGLILKHPWFCRSSGFSHREEPVLCSTPQTCPCQPLPRPSPCHLLSLLICKAIVPAKTPQKKRDNYKLSPLHHDTAQAVMLQKLQRSWNNQGCLGLCPLLSPASSCVPWLAGEAASLSPEHRAGCWLLLCTPNKTAGTDRQTHVAGL